MKFIKVREEDHKQLNQWKLDYDCKNLATVIHALVQFAKKKEGFRVE